MAGLTIGSVAEACGLSKSGMFAHFGSKEALQLAVVENAQQHFVREVFQPILTLERGLPRLQAMMAAWLGRLDDSHDLPGGCPLMAAVYGDDQPGAVRDALVAGQGWQRDTLLRLVQSACEAGQLPADTDAEVLALLLFGLVQGRAPRRTPIGPRRQRRAGPPRLRHLAGATAPPEHHAKVTPATWPGLSPPRPAHTNGIMVGKTRHARATHANISISGFFMLDIQLLRNRLDAVTARLAARGFTLDAEAFAQLEHERKTLQTRTQDLQARRNSLSKQVGEAKRKGEDASAILAEVAGLGDELKANETALAQLQDRLSALLMTIPNLPHESVPAGRDESDNVEVRRVGEPRAFDFR